MKKLYNIRGKHLATVIETPNGLYDVKGVEGTQLSYVKRRGSFQNLSTFKRNFELYFGNELERILQKQKNDKQNQTNIFDYL